MDDPSDEAFNPSIFPLTPELDRRVKKTLREERHTRNLQVQSYLWFWLLSKITVLVLVCSGFGSKIFSMWFLFLSVLALVLVHISSSSGWKSYTYCPSDRNINL